MDIEALKQAIKSEFYGESFESTITTVIISLIKKGVITMEDIKEANKRDN